MINNPKIKVLIIDDHLISVLGTKALLKGSQFIDVVDYATNREEGLKIIEKTPVDVILLDLFMPETDGIDLLREIKMINPNIRIIILTISDEKEKILHAITNDADGYILKDISHEALFHAIKKAHQGKPAFDARVFESIYPDFKQFIKQQYNAITEMKHIFKAEKIKDILTARELDVLKLIAKNMSTAEISDQFGISKFTVSSYRKNLYSKLNIAKLTDLKKIAREIFGENF